jgi:hypothetical protein
MIPEDIKAQLATMPPGNGSDFGSLIGASAVPAWVQGSQPQSVRSRANGSAQSIENLGFCLANEIYLELLG